MSPKKTRPTASEDEFQPWRVALVLGLLLVVSMVAPLVYRMTMTLIEQDHEQLINSNMLAFTISAAFCALFLLVSQSYVKHFSCHLMQDYLHKKQLVDSYHHSHHQPAFILKLFSIFTSRYSHHSATSSGDQHNGRGSPSPFHSSDQDRSGDQEGIFGQRKIDPKYFKPKFIIHELMTFWGTTCTVITWGSFYVIGGTIVATERLAQKIKARSKSRENSFIYTASGGTGQSDFSFSSAFGSSSSQHTDTSEVQQQQQQQEHRQPFRKISSWTKRSVTSIKKKFSRAVRTNALQLTTRPANDSGSSIFFFNTSASN